MSGRIHSLGLRFSGNFTGTPLLRNISLLTTGFTGALCCCVAAAARCYGWRWLTRSPTANAVQPSIGIAPFSAQLRLRSVAKTLMSAITAFFVLSLIALFAAPSCAVHRDEHEVCMGHPFSDSKNNVEWIADSTLKSHVYKRVASPVPSFQVNLGGLPPFPHKQSRLGILTNAFFFL
jgi:hypothetical protein